MTVSICMSQIFITYLCTKFVIYEELQKIILVVNFNSISNVCQDTCSSNIGRFPMTNVIQCSGSKLTFFIYKSE